MDNKILSYLYNNPPILEYLRYHPQWYKILYYAPDEFSNFMDEAKENLKIRTIDKIERFKGQVDFISSLIKYMNK